MAKNNKKIVENYSQEKYDKRYGKSNLRKFTTKFIDKYPSLLEGSRWCKIGDSYYELPKNPFKHWVKGLSVASKVALSVIGVGAVTTAVAVPTVAAINNRIVTKDVTPEGSGSALVNDVTFTKEAGSNYKGVISLHQGVTAEAIESVTIKVGDVTLTKDTDYTLNIETGEIEIQATKVTSIEAITVVVTKRTVFAVTGIKLDSSVKSMLINDKVQLVPTISPSNATNKKVKWTSSNKYVATVDQDGNVSAKKEGTATITATTVDGGFEAKCKLSVSYNGVKVESISMDDTRQVYVGKEEQSLHAHVLPENASNQKIKFISSNPDVATVDENGVVHATLSESQPSGETTITAYSVQNPTIKATCKVYADWLLDEISISSDAQVVDVNTDTSSLEYPNVANLQINKNPGQSAVISDIEWSLADGDSDYATLTVDPNDHEKATLTAIKGGIDKYVKVTVTCKNKEGQECTNYINVKVENSLVSSISLDQSTLTVYENAKATQLTPTVLPADSKYANSLIWSTSNEGYVLVDQEGNVSAKTGFNGKTGTATVTVKSSIDKYSSILSTCQVTAERRVVSITFNNVTNTVYGSSSFNLNAVVTPANATHALEWTSSDPTYLSVDQNGNVTGSSSRTDKNDKSVTITAKADGVIATRVINAKYVAVTSIGTDEQQESSFRYINQTKRLKAILEPSNASNKGIDWFLVGGDQTPKLIKVQAESDSTYATATCVGLYDEGKGGITTNNAWIRSRSQDNNDIIVDWLFYCYK